MSKLLAWCLCVSAAFLVVDAATLVKSYSVQDSFANATRHVNECLKKHITFEPCCGADYFRNYQSENSKTIQDCLLHFTGINKFQCKNLNFEENKLLCIYQCIGQKLEYLDSEGYIIPDRYRTYMTEKLSLVGYSEDFQSKIIENVLSSAADSFSSIGGCKSAGVISQLGLNKQFITHCPEDQMKDKRLCKIIQKRLKESPQCLP